MSHFDELVLQETNEEWPNDLDACRWGRPLDTVRQSSIILAVEVNIEGLNTVSHDEHLLEVVEDRHRNLLEVNHSCATTIALSVLLARLWPTRQSAVLSLQLLLLGVIGKPFKCCQFLYCLQLPDVEASYLLAATAKSDLEPDVFGLARLIGDNEDVLKLREMDTLIHRI